MMLSTRIARWRKAKGMTRQELADAVGVTPAAVYQWEGTSEHKTQPSTRHLEKIVKALGLTMVEFYGAIDEARAS